MMRRPFLKQRESDRPCADGKVDGAEQAVRNPAGPHAPRLLKSGLRRALDLLRKPELTYLELHLTDHCNLNCRACDHYCPVAPPQYADLPQYLRDLRRLRQLFRNIRRIRLLGGEPLLHPDPASFLRATRDVFARTRIRFVTNGILLPKASQEFWQACRETRTAIEVTVYPPLRDRVAQLRSLCEAGGVDLRTTDRDMFHSHTNLQGDSDKQRAFDICRQKYYTPFLQGGRLYACPTPALVRYFNQRFHHAIAADAGIDIHCPHASGAAILRQLDQPMETCKWCSYDFVPFPWSTSTRRLEEWDAATYRTVR